MAEQVSHESAAGTTGFGFEVQDPHKFAQNMTRLLEETAKAVTAYVEPRLNNPAQAFASGDFGRMINAFSKIQGAWLAHPQKFMHAQLDLWQRYMNLWGAAFAGGQPVAAPDPKDIRFKDPAWSQNQYFDFMKQAYLINSRWAEHLVEDAEDVDPDTRQKASFYMKQMMNALAPSNWVFTNPELLRETFAQDGDNLVGAQCPHRQGEQDRGIDATGKRDAQRGRSHEPGAHRLGGRQELAGQRLIYQTGHVGHLNCP